MAVIGRMRERSALDKSASHEKKKTARKTTAAGISGVVTTAFTCLGTSESPFHSNAPTRLIPLANKMSPMVEAATAKLTPRKMGIISDMRTTFVGHGASPSRGLIPEEGSGVAILNFTVNERRTNRVSMRLPG